MNDSALSSLGEQITLHSPIVVAGFYNPLTAAAGLGTVMRAIAPKITQLHVVCIENNAPRCYQHPETSHWVHPLSINEALIQAYHRSFCKGYLSHMLHEEAPDVAGVDPAMASGIEEFSRCYVRHLLAVLSTVTPKPIVWFNDYAMIPVLKEFLTSAPERWPVAISIRSSFGITCAPQVDTYTQNLVLKALLGADFVSFHRQRDVYHFLDMVRIHAPTASIDWTNRTVKSKNQTLQVGAVPMGASADHWREAGASTTAMQIAESIAREAKGTAIILSVSRLERHKAINFELDVIERLLTYFPQLCRRVCFIRITPLYPECTTETRYIDLKAKLEARAAGLNQLFGDKDWQPVKLLSGRSLSHEELAGYYRAASAVLVLSSADGFNHVSIESVLSKHRGDPPLALLLSDTGSSDYLGASFIQAGSKSAVDVALSLGRVLEAGRNERIRLHESLLAAASSLSVTDWMYKILGAVAHTHERNTFPSRVET